ncbi:MAG: DM13 domain-containing protein, partial [Candidatus Acidiferrales bacterium]
SDIGPTETRPCVDYAQLLKTLCLDSVELGPLKGNQGDQNYDLPTSVDLQKYNAAVIYCERFHAVFGVAKLEQF